MSTLHRILIASAAASVLAPAAAQAEVFCVGAPGGCAGTAVSAAGFGDALTLAETNGTDDRFVLAAGQLPAGQVDHTSLERVEIVGAGRAKTVLRGTGTGTVLTIGGNRESSVSALSVEGGPESKVTLSLSRAEARDVAVRGGPKTELASVHLAGGATIASSRIEGAGGPIFTAAVLGRSGDASVLDSTIVAPKGAGIVSIGNELTVRRSRIAAQAGVMAGAHHASVTDTFVDLRGVEAANNLAVGILGLSQSSQTDGRTSTDVERVTVVGQSAPDENVLGVGARASGNGTSASLTMRDSVIHGIAAPLARGADDGGRSELRTVRSSYLITTDLPFEFGPGQLVEEDTLPVSPGFVDAAGGDFRLGAGSKLVDRGATSVEDGARDVDGRARVSDGDGDCARAADIGAFERQGETVRAVATASAASAVVGAEIRFSSEASCTPTAGPSTTWSFDDGATATGSAPAHVFSTPGRHTATAVVRDAEGASGEASVTVDVAAAAAAAPAPTAPRSAPPAAARRRPSVTFSLPACKRTLSEKACRTLRTKRSAWKVLRGTAKDASKVVVTIKGRRGKVRTVTAAVRNGRWTVKVKGTLKKGRTTFTARAIALDGTTSKPAIRKAGLR